MKGFQLVNKKATHILTMDGDLNHQPEEIKGLINKNPAKLVNDIDNEKGEVRAIL